VIKKRSKIAFQSTNPGGSAFQLMHLIRVLLFSVLVFGALVPLPASSQESHDADLLSLTLNGGILSPAFASDQVSYIAKVPYTTTSVTVTAMAQQAGATVKVNGTTVASGSTSAALELAVGGNILATVVTAGGGVTNKTYTVTVLREAPAPGELDMSFDDEGNVFSDIPNSEGRKVVVQSDGKILVVGTADNASKLEIVLARYLANGAPDPSFGVNGIVKGGADWSGVNPESVAIQGDGKIVISGWNGTGSGGSLVLVRYNNNGTLDASFGQGGIAIPVISTSVDRGNSVAILKDGKILVGGSTYGFGMWHDFLLARFTPTGDLDRSFGKGGFVATDFLTYYDYGIAMALQSNGRIVVAGRIGSGSLSDIGLVRYNANGSLDTSFGTKGLVTVQLGGFSNDQPHDMLLQSDGKIVVAGQCGSYPDDNFCLLRLNPNGTADQTFGSEGKVITDMGGSDVAEGVTLQSDGRLIVSGYSMKGGNWVGVLMRHHPDGGLDSSFGDGGKVLIDYSGTYDVAADVTLQPNGKIVVAGTSNSNGTRSLMVSRYNAQNFAPDIAVQSPAGVNVNDGGTRAFDRVELGLQKTITFTVSNGGSSYMEGLAVTVDGPDASRFTVTKQPAQMLLPGATSTLAVTYAPNAPQAHSAVMHITSNDSDESPYDIALTGTGFHGPRLPMKSLAATEIGFDSAILNGAVEPKGAEPVMSFEYGLTNAYGTTVAATPGIVIGHEARKVSAGITGLMPHTKYHYRLRAEGSNGVSTAAALSFTTQNRDPVAVNDGLPLLPGAVVVLDVLANDSDADGDGLSIVSTTAIPSSAGKVTKVNGRLVFTAASTFSGTSFDYGIKDNFGGAASATVALTLGESSIDPPSKELPSAGGRYKVAVAGVGAWSVNEDVPWISAAPTSQPAAGEVEITVQPNASKTVRSATIRVAGKPHVITQGMVLPPDIGQPPVVPAAIVSGDFALPIPTTNAPVTYTVTKLPPGLTLDQSTGVIGGKPTKAGTYAVVVKAQNAAGPAPTTVGFDIVVSPLPEEVPGTYHGYMEADETVNGLMGARFEMVIATTGAVSGKIVTGTTAKNFAGALNARPDFPNEPEFNFLPLGLSVAVDATNDSLSGTVSAVPMRAWRQVWRAVSKPATAYEGLHTFYLTPPPDAEDLPEGYGFGAFTVDEKTGALKITGKLADGSAFLTSTFLGRQGQVLIYQPLYGNKGSFGGSLDVAANNTISGSPFWYKPAAAAKARDTVYSNGFGPAGHTAVGGSYGVPPRGAVIMGLRNGPGNAFLNFTEGGLDVENKEFGIVFDLVNPSVSGLTNIATFPSINPNKIKLTMVSPATGAFAGEFTIPGAMARKVTFQGQVAGWGGGTRGYGFFLLPEQPVPPLTLSTVPKNSGRVIFRDSDL
jgi:uncharacterized delta-60 repeat protein